MTDSNSSTLLIFPGQGSQYPGIGKDLFQAFESTRKVYGEASEVLGYDIAALSFDDPQQQIHLTRYTQPVLLTHSVACLQAFTEVTAGRVSARAAAGHSLGEYSALVAAGVLEFAVALRLVAERGRLMGELGEGEMEALPLDLESARSLANRHYCAVAACNLPEQTAVGGRTQDLDALVAELQETHPGKRSTRLKTEGAFHTYYMVEAARRFREVLEAADFHAPALKVLSNYTGSFHPQDAAGIKANLFAQLFKPVLWHANLLQAVDGGCDTIIEFGGGIGKGASAAEKNPNLAGIVKKTFRRHQTPPTYHAVINCDTLTTTAGNFGS